MSKLNPGSTHYSLFEFVLYCYFYLFIFCFVFFCFLFKNERKWIVSHINASHEVYGWNKVDIRHLKYLYLEHALCQTFYLVPSAFSLTFFINSCGISNSTIFNNFLGPFSHFWAVSHLLHRTFAWGFRMNHDVHFRHSNVKSWTDKTLFGSLFFLFFSTSFRQHVLS